MAKKLSHVDHKGAAHMVDVGPKNDTERRAVAEASVRMKPETLSMILDGQIPKGDVLAVARTAGIMAAKKTHDLIPLCHPLFISSAKIEFEPDLEIGVIKIFAEVKTCGKTGVEMEALTAVSVTALTLYDMVKAVEKSVEIQLVRLVEKQGGASGHYRADDQ